MKNDNSSSKSMYPQGQYQETDDRTKLQKVRVELTQGQKLQNAFKLPNPDELKEIQEHKQLDTSLNNLHYIRLSEICYF